MLPVGPHIVAGNPRESFKQPPRADCRPVRAHGPRKPTRQLQGCYGRWRRRRCRAPRLDATARGRVGRRLAAAVLPRGCGGWPGQCVCSSTASPAGSDVATWSGRCPAARRATSARLTCGRSRLGTLVPVFSQLARCVLGEASSPESRTGTIERPELGPWRRSALGPCFRPISAIALHRDSVIAKTAFPQGKTLGERRRNRGRSPSYLLLVVLLDR